MNKLINFFLIYLIIHSFNFSILKLHLKILQKIIYFILLKLKDMYIVNH